MKIDGMDDLYEIVGQELKNGKEQLGLMARAAAEADGNPEKAKSLYIRYRVAELAENRQREAEKRVRDETELFPEILAEARKWTAGFDYLSAEEKLTKYLEYESPKILFQEGLHQHHTVGNIDAAVKRYKRIIKRFPNDLVGIHAQTQLDKISAASKADPVQGKLAPIFNLLGFEASTEDPGKWTAKERTGSDAPRPSATDLTRPIRSDPNPVTRQSAAYPEIKTSAQPNFDQQPTGSSKQTFASGKPSGSVAKAGNSVDLPTHWLWFYTYIGLPLGILLSFVPTLAEIYDLRHAGYQIQMTFLMFVPIIVYDVFLCFLIYGLHKRRFWGWVCNWIALGMVVLFNAAISKESFEVYLGTALLLSIIFFLPNFFYFKKRRSLYN
jgi:hypothetical protein